VHIQGKTETRDRSPIGQIGGFLQVLAYFSDSNQGRCKEVAQSTGLSLRSARRHLKELTDVGLLAAMESKTFPPTRRYWLLEDSKEVARAAAILLRIESDRRLPPGSGFDGSFSLVDPGLAYGERMGRASPISRT